MAIIKINGTVDRIFQDGRCVKLTEKSGSGDKTYTDRYTAWFEQSPGLTEGQEVAVSGFISVKQGKPWKDRDGNERTSIDVNVNKARVDGKSDSAPAAQQDEPWASAPAADVWADSAPADYSDSTPF